MAANELAEALQALIWVQMLGEAGQLTEDGIGIRAQCGFQQRVIASEAAKDFGLLILLLERTHSRRESAIVVSPVGTTGTQRDNYPQPGESGTGQLELPTRAPAIQPIMLEWLGPDLGAPTWLPFGDETLPSTANADQFDAIAVLQPANDEGNTLAGDFSIALYKMPPLPDGTVATVEKVLPVPIVP